MSGSDPIEYKLIRSDRKTLRLEINAALEVVVRAPKRCSKREIDAFVRKNAEWIASARPRVAAWYEAHPEPSEAQRLWCIDRLKTLLPGKLSYYSALLGVTFLSWRITGARTRFGSCSSRGTLCFSWRLMLYPEAVTDALVVHELAHLIHMDHSPAFYETVLRVMPDYRERIALLKLPPTLPIPEDTGQGEAAELL